jgi:hypothetical protein
VIEVGSGAIVAIAALIGIVQVVVPTVRKEVQRRRQPQAVRPTRSIAASYRLPSGESVPAGDYRCPKDMHQLDVDCRTASARCPSCGRNFRVMYGKAPPD